MNYEDNPGSIKFYVKRYLMGRERWLKGKKVIDFPAGNGVTSKILRGLGAEAIPVDLFPEYFQVDGLECTRANISEGLPLKGHSADVLICQEGIEHFSDQYGAFREFNRLLKPGGTLLVTTPNYSNLRAKLSYLLTESERFNDIMAPNELDSIWMSDQSITDEIYFGHIFLIGIQKLRALAKLAGFEIKEIHFTRARPTSMLLFPFFYPFIWLSNLITYRKNLRKNKDFDEATKKSVYREIYRLAVDPKILVDGHLMVEFTKNKEQHEVGRYLKSKHKEFGLT